MSSLKSNKNSSIVQEALFKSYFVESSSVVKSTHLKFMDFCAGIGGGRLAFENLGLKCVGFSVKECLTPFHSMGSAKRLDPTKIEYISIWKTHGDALTKKVRDELKGMNFKPDFKVIFSSEVPQCTDKGSFVGVTGAFGLILAAKAIERLTKDATSVAKYKT